MCSGTEAGLYLRLTDSCITQLKAQGPCRTCTESKKEEEGLDRRALGIVLLQGPTVGASSYWRGFFTLVTGPSPRRREWSRYPIYPELTV